MLDADSQLASPAPRFQRAIHVRYDRGDADIVAQYVPTESSTGAIRHILENTRPQSTQRAHVLHAAYGSGKSHLAVALTALLDNDSTLGDAIARFIEQVGHVDSNSADLASEYLDANRRLFPIILSGNEGDFATSILRALTHAIDDSGITEFQLSTRFDAAIETIRRWQADFPETAQRFKTEIAQQARQTCDTFIDQLDKHDADSYRLFEVGVFGAYRRRDI